MARAERIELIRQLEALRKSKIIAYCTSDRAMMNLPSGQIAEDAIRPLHQILRTIGKTRRLDLFLYTRGGAVDVPWRVVTALRQYSDEWNCLVPFRAHSAGTLIAIGADQIVMGKQGELGAIDPSISFARPGTNSQDRISVEDAMAFVSFVQKKCGADDAAVKTGAILRLLDRVDAVALGHIYRNHAHIRDVARRILESRPVRLPRARQRRVISTLAERVYAHGHAVSFSEAQEFGLQVASASEAADELMWKLLLDYESEMKILTPLDPATLTATKEQHQESVLLAALETATQGFVSAGQLEVRVKRELPQNFSPQISLNMQLPAGLDLAQLPANQQQLLQQLVQAAATQLQQEAARILLAELAKISPIRGYDLTMKGLKWEQVA